MSDLIGGALGSKGKYDVKFENGALAIAGAYDPVSGVELSLNISVGAGAVIDALEPHVPDAVKPLLEAAKAALVPAAPAAPAPAPAV